MVAGSGLNAPVISASAIICAVLLGAFPLQAFAGSAALMRPVADEMPYDGGAAGDGESDADRPAQRQPDTEAPSEDGTDGATGGNAAEPPAGCMFRDGPLELVV